MSRRLVLFRTATKLTAAPALIEPRNSAPHGELNSRHKRIPVALCHCLCFRPRFVPSRVSFFPVWTLWSTRTDGSVSQTRGARTADHEIAKVRGAVRRFLARLCRCRASFALQSGPLARLDWP